MYKTSLEVRGQKRRIDVKNVECNRSINQIDEIEISLGKINYILYVNDIALLYIVCWRENI